MLIRYLQDCNVAYDGINIVVEKKRNKQNVENELARALIASGRAEVYSGEKVEEKQIKEYENKSVTPRRGRPKKA